jgi:UDP-glucose 4-epimerase
MTPTDSDRNVLVTGGAGFIGSHLIEVFTRRGDHVTIVDDLSTGSLANIQHVPQDQLTVHQTTVTQAMPELKPGSFDEIYHLAAAVGVRLVIEEPIHTIETNVHETSAVLRFAAMHGTPTLIASTSEVYGKSSKTPFAEDDDVVYGSTTLSRWSYACSKAIDEYLTLAYARQHQLPAVVMRFFNTVGPRQTGRYGMVLPRFVAAALAGDDLQVHGDGQQSRCFCDVRDVVDVLPQMLSQRACAGRVFNIGNDQPITIAELAALVKSTLNSTSNIVTVPYEEAFGEGFDDLRTRQPDITRLRAAVGFTPRYELVQTIRDIAAHMQQTPESSMESLT